MLLIRPHEAIAPTSWRSRSTSFSIKSTNLAVDDRPAHARAPPELGQRELAVRMSQQFRNDRPDRVGTHERRKLRSGLTEQEDLFRLWEESREPAHTLNLNSTTSPHVETSGDQALGARRARRTHV